MQNTVSLQSNKSDKDAINEEHAYRLDASTRWRYCPSSTTHSSSSSSSRWQPSSDLWSTWNRDSWESWSWSEHFLKKKKKKRFQMSDFYFACRKFLSPGKSTEGVNGTPSAHTFFSHAHFVSVLVPACCHSCAGGYSHIVGHWPHTLHRAMSHVTPYLTTPSTRTPCLSSIQSSSPAFHPLLSEPEPRADHDPTRVALWLSPHPSQVMSPSSFLNTRITGISPKNKQLAEHEDLRVKPLFFHQPSTASTYDSAESIVTPPPDSDLDDEQIRALLVSALLYTHRSEKRMRNDHKFITLHEKTWCPVHFKIR